MDLFFLIKKKSLWISKYFMVWTYMSEHLLYLNDLFGYFKIQKTDILFPTWTTVVCKSSIIGSSSRKSFPPYGYIYVQCTSDSFLLGYTVEIPSTH